MKIHVIQKGETLADIALQYGVELESVIKNNPQIANPDAVVPGMKLMIPQQSSKVGEKGKVSSKQKHKKPHTKEANNTEETMRRPIGIALHDDGLKSKSQQDSVRIFRPQDRPFNELTHRHTINNTTNSHNQKHDEQKDQIYCDCCHRPIYFE